MEIKNCDILEAAQVVVASAMVLFVTGTVAALANAISKYALPRFGYHEIFGISLVTINRNTLITTYICWGLTTFITVALMSVILYMPPIRCGGGEFSP